MMNEDNKYVYGLIITKAKTCRPMCTAPQTAYSGIMQLQRHCNTDGGAGVQPTV